MATPSKSTDQTKIKTVTPPKPAARYAVNPADVRTEGRLLPTARQRQKDNGNNGKYRLTPQDDSKAPTKVIGGGLRVPDPDAVTERDVKKTVPAKTEAVKGLGDVGTAAQVAVAEGDTGEKGAKAEGGEKGKDADLKE